MERKTTQSAGGVVLNKDKVIVVSQKGTSWSLPKGHLEAGETEEEAARREIAEESGVTDLVLIRKLGSYERFKIGKNGVGEDTTSLKYITMFLFTTDHQVELLPQDVGNPEARWVRVDEVAKLLTHPKDSEFFESIKVQLQ